MFDFSEIIQFAIIGIGTGSIISMAGMGLTLSYGVIKFPNVAHGYSMVLGMFIALTVYQLLQGVVELEAIQLGATKILRTSWFILPALLVAMLTVGLLAVTTELLVFRPIRKKSPQSIVTPLIASIGVAILLHGILQYIWGVIPRIYDSGIVPNLQFFDYQVAPRTLIIFGTLMLVTILLYILLYRTTIGKTMRATSNNSELAEVSGINTNKVRLITWFVGGLLTGLAGVLFALQVNISITTGLTILLPVFAAVIVGGIGNPWGALTGGLIIGISQEISVIWIDPGYKQAITFIILIIVLLIRPRGLFTK